MCGFNGLFGGDIVGDALQSHLVRMRDVMTHRGPDDAGVWTATALPVGLAHRRLSILDTSPLGHQPMVSHCGRYTIAFNGEIYNFADMRSALEAEGAAPQWRGTSDTEVLLAALGHWGVRDTLLRTNGMFAFALWDANKRTLTLARDRLGIKPCIYGFAGKALAFGSEVKAVAEAPGFERKLDLAALAELFRRNGIPHPQTAYVDARQLPPGCYAVSHLDDPHALQIHRYYDMGAVVDDAKRNPWPESDPEGAVDAVEDALLKAVERRMVADVPLGALLSGGIDSSLIVSLLARLSDRKIQTFALGFDSKSDESVHAQAIADHLGTDHQRIVLSPEHFNTLMVDFVDAVDQPFIAPSIVPTTMVSGLAREHVTVALTGDGGDELFGGYRHHVDYPRAWDRVRGVPYPLRAAAAGAVDAMPRSAMQATLMAATKLPKVGHKFRYPLQKVDKATAILRARSFDEIPYAMEHRGRDPGALVVGAGADKIVRPHAHLDALDEQLMWQDCMNWLPDVVLHKLDVATMAVSLEGRVPLLDHEVAALAWRLPSSIKIRDGKTKWPLREVLARHVPRELFERPKRGFGIGSLGDWLRGPLRPWVQECLSPARVAQQGVLDEPTLREHLRAFDNREHDAAAEIFGAALVSQWVERNGGYV